MGEAAPTGALTNRKPSTGGQPLALLELDALLFDLLGKPPRRDRLERDDRAYRWIIRKVRAEGNPFRTTYTQAAAGLGYELSGDREADFKRYNSRVARALNALQEAGLITWGGIKRGDGRWQCLEVRLLDGARERNARQRTIRAAGSTAPRRRSHRQAIRRPLVTPDNPGGNECQPRRRYRTPAKRRRIFFGPKVDSPSGEGKGFAFPFQHQTPRGSLRAREAPPPQSRSAQANPEHRERRPGVVAGLEDARSTLERRSDPLAAARDAITAGASPIPWLCAAFEHIYGRPARLSLRRWGETLTRALRRLDRYADFGAGREGAGALLALELMEAGAGGEAWTAPVNPASLAYFVPELDSISKTWRRAHRPRIKAERAARKRERAAAAARSDESQTQTEGIINGE